MPCPAKVDEVNRDRADSRVILLSEENPEMRLLTSPDASKARWAEGLPATNASESARQQYFTQTDRDNGTRLIIIMPGTTTFYYKLWHQTSPVIWWE